MTLDLTHALTIEGEGGPGDAGGASSVLRWAADTSGIRVQTHNTVGTGGVRPSAPLDRGDSSVIQGLHLQGAYSGSEGEFHGIQLRGRAMIRDCYISGFQGDGIHIVATAGAGEGGEGNANCFEVRKCWIDFCRNGMLVDGADANAGSVTNVNANYNRQWGIRDSSFLGNCYTGCHAAENGAGPYRTEDPSARNMFIGCYSEGGQPPSSFSPPTLLLGGLHGAGTGDYGGQLGVEFNQALKAEGALEVGTRLAVGSDASVGGNLTVDGMSLANGNMVVRGTFNATGANSAFGPQTGPGSDCNLFIDNTNYNAFIYFRSWSEGLPQFDGWLRGRRHAGVEINGVAGVALQHNAETIVSIADAALDIAEGSVLKIGGSQVVGEQQFPIADDASGAANQTTVNAILSALRNHGLIATQP
jgi:hypothetical protein